MAPRLSYRKGVRSTAHTVALRTGGTLARTFFASMTDKVRSAHTPMRTLSILLPSVIMAAIRLSGPTSLCPPCFLAYADRAVQPPRRSLMQTCPHRRPLPAVGFARARPSGCVRPTWSRSTFSFLFFVWFVLFPDLNASLPLLFTGGYRSHPTKESFCARSSPHAVSGPRLLLLLNIMT